MRVNRQINEGNSDEVSCIDQACHNDILIKGLVLMICALGIRYHREWIDETVCVCVHDCYVVYISLYYPYK